MIANGCGPDWMPKFVKAALFNWFFEASCDRHDEGYQEGGDEARRRVCDDKFLAAMLRDVNRIDWYMRPVALATAYTFYGIVRAFGKSQFNYTG